MLLRRHTSELTVRGVAASDGSGVAREGRSHGGKVLREQCRALLRRLADWAAEADRRTRRGGTAAVEAAMEGETGGEGGEGAGGWLNRLTELPLNAMGEYGIRPEWEGGKVGMVKGQGKGQVTATCPE